MGVHALYRGSIYYGWDYTLDFETGIFRCTNHYGSGEYHLDEEELIAFEKGIVDSHALDWTPDGIHTGFDGRNWVLEIIFPDGSEFEIGGMHSYKYNYEKLEHTFVFTEQRHRGGPLGYVDYLKRVPLKERVDYTEARRKYFDDFQH